MKNSMLNKLRQAQDGAAVLMVLLVTVFVVMMGSSVLFSSYNGYLVQLVERDGLGTFYSAEDKLTQVKAVVQDFSSDALQSSYTKVMSEYALWMSQDMSEEVLQAKAQEKFTTYFLDELNKLFSVVVDDAITEEYEFSTGNAKFETGDVEFDDDSNDKLFYFDGSLAGALGDLSLDLSTDLSGVSSGTSLTGVSGGIYHTTILESIAGLLGDSECSITAANGTADGSTTGTFVLESSVSGDRLVMKDVMISYKDENGYQSYIVTDIIIEMPDFVHNGLNELAYYKPGSDGNTLLDNASSIAKLWVKSSATYDEGLLVTGDLYGGTFFIYNENSTGSDDIIFSHGEGRLITHTDKITKSSIEAGNVSTGSTNDDHFNFDTGTIKGDSLMGFEVYDGTKFFTQASSEIWSSNVNVLGGSMLTLQGKEGVHYLANIGDYQNMGGVKISGDLLVEGGTATNKTDLTLAGDFFGFGQGGDAKGDSALLIAGNNVNVRMEFDENHPDWYENYTLVQVAEDQGDIGIDEDGNQVTYRYHYNSDGSKVTLDYIRQESELETLSLAGLAYLDPVAREGASGTEYAMGQSMATLFDQVAYLIPAEALEGVSSNPSSSNKVTVVNLNYELWPGTTIGDYCDSSAPVVITNPYITGESASYYFFNFEPSDKNDSYDSVSRSNDYFRAYVSANGQAFTNTTSKFVTMQEITEQFFELNSQGNVYYNTSEDGITIADNNTNEDLVASAADEELRFQKSSITLDPDFNFTTRGVDTVGDDGLVDVKRVLPVYESGELTGVKVQNYLTGRQTAETTVGEAVIRQGEVTAGAAGWDTVDNPYDFFIDQSLIELDKLKSVETGIWGNLFFRKNNYIYAMYSGGGVNYETNNFMSRLYYANSAFGDTSSDYLSLIFSASGINIQMNHSTTKDLFEGLAMSRVGIALVTPIKSNRDGFHDALEATTEIYLTANQSAAGVGVPIEVVLDINEGLPETLEQWVERQENSDYLLLQKEYRKGSEFNTYDHTDGKTYLTLTVPCSAYFRNLDAVATPGTSDSTITGSNRDEAFVNWDSEDLVYFENWEKY